MKGLALSSLVTALVMSPVTTLAQPGSVAGGTPTMLNMNLTGDYCMQGNLIYSFGGITCFAEIGMVCVPSGQTEGKFIGPAYWSPERRRFGEVEFKPPTSCRP